MTNSLSKIVSDARKEKRYTLAQVSMKANISVSYLSDIEHGRKTPSFATLKRIVKVLEIPIDKLLYDHA